MIPRFCFHPALGSVGACRVCVVSILEGRVEGVQMSCMLDAVDDMVVSTTHKDAVDFRRDVIEWLMANHPHDCPVCDEGGHCLLQDMTVSGGHGLRKFPGTKRTHRDQYLGPLIQHEMNRCIQCYRCTRFYREFSGYEDLGVMGIGARVYFGRYQEGTLENPFAGNITDICPTGVFTDKPSRYKGRRWDYERRPSICLSCSLGCHTIASARYRQVVRQEAGYSETVNGYFICDRGRHGFVYASAKDRPRTALLTGKTTALDDALSKSMDRLKQIAEAHGPGAVAVAGSTRASLESHAAALHLCREMSYQGPAFWMTTDQATTASAAAQGLNADLAISLKDLENADGVLVIAADPVNDAPMLEMALRQAWRNGAWVSVLDPRPVQTSFPAKHVPVAPGDLPDFLVHVMALFKNDSRQGLPDRIETKTRQQLDSIARLLKQCIRPAIVCGTDHGDPALVVLATDFAETLRNAGKQSGLFYLLDGPNGMAAAMHAGEPADFQRILASIENGSVRALVLFESDPFMRYPDRKRLTRCLEKLDLLVVMDYLSTPATTTAHVFLPTTTIYESDGTYMNQEGRLQWAAPIYGGGLSVLQEGRGDHPLRVFRTDAPGTEPVPTWKILTALASAGVLPEHVPWPETGMPVFEWLAREEKIPEWGRRVLPDRNLQGTMVKDSPADSSEHDTGADMMVLITVDRTFGTEELSCRSTPLQELEAAPAVFMHPTDATEMGLTDGEHIVINTGIDKIRVLLQISEAMARGVVLLPRHHRLDWQCLPNFQIPLHRDHIEGAEGGGS